MPEKIIEEITETWPSPPGMWPTSARAKRKIRLVIPPVFIRLPARMKKGTASSVKPVVPEYMRCGSMASKLPCPRPTKKPTAVSPMATAMGRSKRMSSSRTRKMERVSMGSLRSRKQQGALRRDAPSGLTEAGSYLRLFSSICM